MIRFLGSLAVVLLCLWSAPALGASTRPRLERSDLLGKVYYYSPAMTLDSHGHVYAAWSTWSGKSYIARVNVRRAQTSLLADVTGYAVAMVAAPDGSLYVGLQTKPAGDVTNAVTVVKVAPTGQALWSSTFPNDGKGTWVEDLAVDRAGNVYAAGYTFSPSMGTPDAFQSAPMYSLSGFVRKLSPEGHTAYSSYIGGPSDVLPGSYASAVAVDRAGDAYVTGWTFSTSFPLVKPLQTQPRSMFLSEFDPTGSRLLFSTYLGGKAQTDIWHTNYWGDQPSAIALGKDGSIYLAGAAHRGFPTTGGAFQRRYAVDTYPDNLNPFNTNGFIMKIRPNRTVAYSTYLGGSTDDAIAALAVDAHGDAVVAGTTDSAKFPLAHPFQAKHGTGQCWGGGEDHEESLCVDGFVSTLDPTGSGLLFSSFLGGNRHDWIVHLAANRQGTVFAEGVTKSASFPSGMRASMASSVPVCSDAQLRVSRCRQVFIARIAGATR